MRYLIDGYNLMYALGLVRRNGGRAGWNYARRTMLDWLADQLGHEAGDARVVFDAQNALGGLIEENHRGLHVLRDRGRSADDLIEDLLKAEHVPETLIVVSNDARIRDSATRNGCRVDRCSEFVDALIDAKKRAMSARKSDEKDIQPSPDETEKWMKAFGG